MQEPDVRIHPGNYLTIKFQYETQDSMSCGMLRTEVYCEIA